MNHGYVTITTCIFGISLAICKFLLYVFFRQLLGGVISKFCPLVFHPINRNRYEHKGIYFLDLLIFYVITSQINTMVKLTLTSTYITTTLLKIRNLWHKVIKD